MPRDVVVPDVPDAGSAEPAGGAPATRRGRLGYRELAGDACQALHDLADLGLLGGSPILLGRGAVRLLLNPPVLVFHKKRASFICQSHLAVDRV